MIILIAALAGLSALLLVASLGRLQQEVQPEERQYMDPLPPLLRMLWPLVEFVTHHFTSRVPTEHLQRVHERLRTTGVSYLLNAEQFIAVRLLSTAITALVTWLAMASLHKFSLSWLLILTLLGYVYPLIWLNDVRKRRHKMILKALPVYLDFITLSVEAGLNLTGAITQTIEKGPPGPLRHELYLVMRDIRSGLSRADALRRLDARIQMDAITSLVGTIVQAEKMGASLGNALRIQAEQRRTERFQRAEKQAMEAPVKLLGPLILFIFPLTFLVLAFPIVMKFLQSGML